MNKDGGPSGFSRSRDSKDISKLAPGGTSLIRRIRWISQVCLAGWYNDCRFHSHSKETRFDPDLLCPWRSS